MGDTVLDISGLTLRLRDTAEPLVTEVSLTVGRGEMVGLVGESGSGKTLTGLAAAGLLPRPIEIAAGDVEVQRAAGERRVRADRPGRDGVAMIFQNPSTSLNPSMSIGRQIAEAYRQHHEGVGRRAGLAEAERLLEQVRIPRPRQCAKSFPHQLSGGMKQRVMIAIALACDPDVIIADEPTTALDVSVERSVMDLLDELRVTTSVGVLMISHDIELIGERSERLLVMYAGELVEVGATRDVLQTPRHPYVQALLACSPHHVSAVDELVTLRGGVPRPSEVPVGCRFAARCPQRLPSCDVQPQVLEAFGVGRAVRCHVATGRAPRPPVREATYDGRPA